MKARYPALCNYVRELVYGFFGGPVEIGDALLSSHPGDSTAVEDSVDASREGRETSLPWTKPDGNGLNSTGSGIVKTAFEAVPLIGQLHKSNLLLDSNNSKTAFGANEQPTQAIVSSSSSPTLPVILAIGSIVTGVAGYLVYSGLLNLPIGNSPSVKNKRLSDMGEAGAMLAMADFGEHGSKLAAEDTPASRVPVGLEVDVDID